MTFANLALICAVAILGPVLAVQKWAHLPVVLGELLVGFLLGATGLQVLHAGDPTFTFFGDVGFALVMLVAGAHVPVRSPQLRPTAGSPTESLSRLTLRPDGGATTRRPSAAAIPR